MDARGGAAGRVPAGRAPGGRAAEFGHARCQRCGFALPPAARFCPGCGTALAEAPGPAPQLRHVVVLFYDLVGSTSLVNELGPETSADLIGAFHGCMTRVMERHGGFVSRYVGDGGLVYFGFPRADEDDALRAARAATEALAALRGLTVHGVRRSLAMRIGMAAGLTMFSDVSGRGGAHSLESAGAAPSLAARLLEAAAPGAVVLSDPLRRLLGNSVEVESLGEVGLKGWPEPLPVWRLRGVARQPDRLRARSAEALKLFGREKELDLLLAAWRQAKGGSGQMLLVQGEAGIGKSRLTRALIDRVRAEDGTCLRLFCSPENAATPFAAGIQHIEHWLRFAECASAEIRAARLADAVAGVDALSADLVRTLLGVPVQDEAALATLTPRQRLTRLSVTFAEMMTARCSQEPVLIQFEDLHWIYPSTLPAMSIIAELVGSLPLLTVLTARPDLE